jgi:hypothetical protein
MCGMQGTIDGLYILQETWVSYYPKVGGINALLKLVYTDSNNLFRSIIEVKYIVLIVIVI